ncbi:hypothetical protein [Sediminitomix flava]|nr:hypothetical protein [Sediminitomix flava]
MIFPWWGVIAVCSFIYTLFMPPHSGWQAFFMGFFALLLLWGSAASVIDIQNEGILSKRIAMILQLPRSVYLVALTAFLGGLIAGLSSLSGFHFRRMLSI